MTVFEAATRYAAEGVSLVVLAGKEYGTGSSRDWAAKGTALLGVRAVLAESYERIHRSNLSGMGVLPLQFLDGQSAASLGLRGDETFTIDGLDALEPGANCRVQAAGPDGRIATFSVLARLDTPGEIATWRGGGLLPEVLRSMAAETNEK
jgi:aconitate hydratase